jgi:carboxylate-amine ligase
LIQAIVVKLVGLRRDNLSFASHRTAMMNENKWRAARYGVRGRLIDFGKGAEVEFAQLMAELLAFVDDVLDGLGSRSEVEGVHKILERGTSADRQLEIFDQGGQLEDVVDFVLAETMRGVEAAA